MTGTGLLERRPERRVDENGRRRRRRGLENGQRPGWMAYGFLTAIMLGSMFPLYWSFLIGSGDASTINQQDIVW